MGLGKVYMITNGLKGLKDSFRGHCSVPGRGGGGVRTTIPAPGKKTCWVHHLQRLSRAYIPLRDMSVSPILAQSSMMFSGL